MSTSNSIVKLAAAASLMTFAGIGASKAQSAPGDYFEPKPGCGCWKHHGGNHNNNTNNVGNTNKVDTNSQSYSGAESIAKNKSTSAATGGQATSEGGASNTKISGGFGGLSLDLVQLPPTMGGAIAPAPAGECTSTYGETGKGHSVTLGVAGWSNSSAGHVSQNPDKACMHEVTKGQVAVAALNSDLATCEGRAVAEAQTLADDAGEKATLLTTLLAACHSTVSGVYAPRPVVHHAKRSVTLTPPKACRVSVPCQK